MADITRTPLAADAENQIQIGAKVETLTSECIGWYMLLLRTYLLFTTYVRT